MDYQISPHPFENHYLVVECRFKAAATKTKLQLPAWRPGRYQIQNFAKNIRSFHASDSETKLKFVKKNKDLWEVSTPVGSMVSVRYEYYAFQADAGGSFSNHEILYINPINLCMYIPGEENHSCTLFVQTSFKNSISSLESTYPNQFNASSYHELVDSPIIFSNTLETSTFFCQKTKFHIAIIGVHAFDLADITSKFQNFTQEQIQVFGSIPVSEYRFLLWTLPTPFYHGVEHLKSTMMVMGPGPEIPLTDLLGLASHELFHVWNVKSIRPKELLPYRYHCENYFQTCFLAEGFTTFYGDWMLYRSGVFSREEFKRELESTLKRHFDTSENSKLSLLESSYDLWLDGYEKGAPNRKVSVYNKGAVAAIILNHLLSKTLDHPYPLDVFMQSLWRKFGKMKKGYSYLDVKNIALDLGSKKEIKLFFQEIIEGNSNPIELLNAALFDQGFQLLRNKENLYYLKDLE